MKTQMIFTVILALLGSLIIPLAVVAAEGDTLWTRYYGGEWYEIAWSFCPTEDGGAVLAGYTEHEYAGPSNFYAVRVNGQGDTLWTGEYGGDLFENAYSICPAADGGFLLTGHTNEFGVWSDVWLVKTNAAGLLQWSEHYGGDWWETAYSICPAEDGGFLLAGESGSFTSGGLCLVRVNSFGVQQWIQGYGEDVARAHCAIPAESGGFMVVGHTERYGYYNTDIFLLRVDDEGDTLWTLMFGGDESDFATSVCPSGDGNYLVAGYTASSGAGSWDMYLIKVSDSGDTLWTRTYGGPLAEQANAICSSGDGGFLLAGYTGSTLSGYPDMYLVKIDAEGDTLWTRAYGNYYEDEASSVCLSSDGAILLAGYGQPAAGTFDDMYLLKLEGPDTTAVPPQSPTQPLAFILKPPHPNPFNPTTVLSFELRVPSLVKLEVFDVNGRSVGAKRCFAPASGRPSGSPLQTWYPAGAHQITFDGSELPSGIYFAKLNAGGQTAVQKLVLLK